MHVHDRLYIDGEWVRPINGARIDVVNPATEEPAGRVPDAHDEDVDRAVAAARAALPAWSATGTAERADALRRFAAALDQRRTAIADLLIEEAGIPAWLAHEHQTVFPVRALEQHAFLIESQVLEERIGNSLVIREPIGVVAALAPWNFPLLLAMNKVAPALAAGCTVVLKPSEQSPLHAFLLAEAAADAELPPGVLNVLTGTGPAAGARLSAHPGVDMVSFTGSTEAGKRVAHAAADTLKRVQLELGGKSANVVLDDADLELAVRRGIDQCWWNSGQNCMAWSRMLVPAERQDEVARLAAEVAAEYPVGDPASADTRIGPLISERQAERARGLIRAGLEAGAELVVGGDARPDDLDRGYYVRPTVLAGVDNAMPVAREEVFGPVLSIIPYRGEDEAVAIANDTPYGLHGAVFAGDRERGVAVARRLRTGMVDVNGSPLNGWAPFGGFKQSGVGRELGRYGLEEYYELKSVQC